MALMGTATAAAAAGAAIGAIATQAALAAGKAIETANKFDETFKQFSDDANAWIQQQRGAVGYATSQWQDWLSTIQDTLVPMGIARGKAAELSQSMSKLAVDLGSFKNIDPTRVIQDLQSGLVGQHRALRKYGVVITKTRLKHEAMARGMAENYNELSEQEKLMLRYKIMLESTADAQGDAARTADSFTNTVRRMKGNIKGQNEQVGMMLAQSSSVKGFFDGISEGAKESADNLRILAKANETILEWLPRARKEAAKARANYKSLGERVGALYGNLSMGADQAIKTWGEMGAVEQTITAMTGGTYGFAKAWLTVDDRVNKIKKDLKDAQRIRNEAFQETGSKWMQQRGSVLDAYYDKLNSLPQDQREAFKEAWDEAIKARPKTSIIRKLMKMDDPSKLKDLGKEARELIEGGLKSDLISTAAKTRTQVATEARNEDIQSARKWLNQRKEVMESFRSKMEDMTKLEKVKFRKMFQSGLKGMEGGGVLGKMMDAEDLAGVMRLGEKAYAQVGPELKGKMSELVESAARSAKDLVNELKSGYRDGTDYLKSQLDEQKSAWRKYGREVERINQRIQREQSSWEEERFQFRQARLQDRIAELRDQGREGAAKQLEQRGRKRSFQRMRDLQRQAAEASKAGDEKRAIRLAREAKSYARNLKNLGEMRKAHKFILKVRKQQRSEAKKQREEAKQRMKQLETRLQKFKKLAKTKLEIDTTTAEQKLNQTIQKLKQVKDLSKVAPSKEAGAAKSGAQTGETGEGGVGKAKTGMASGHAKTGPDMTKTIKDPKSFLNKEAEKERVERYLNSRLDKLGKEGTKGAGKVTTDVEGKYAGPGKVDLNVNLNIPEGAGLTRKVIREKLQPELDRLAKRMRRDLKRS